MPLATGSSTKFRLHSHQGDENVAVGLKSGQISYETQYRRIRPIIDRIIQDPALDDDARVALIQEELHNLSNQPDDATIRAVRSQFPDLPNEVVVKDLTDGLDSPGHPPPLAEWWRRYGLDIDPILVRNESSKAAGLLITTTRSQPHELL